MNKNIIKMILFFIISFIISQITVYFLSPDNFLKSPTFVLLPLVGFFGMFFLSPTIMKDLKMNKITVLICFLGLCLLGYYFGLLFYNYNIYVILNNIALKMPYFSMLLESAFFTFMVSGLFGIVFSK